MPCALPIRSEEHTSELQSHDNLVCRLLLEKKPRHRTSPSPRRRPPLAHRRLPAVARARAPAGEGGRRAAEPPRGRPPVIFFFLRAAEPRTPPLFPPSGFSES